MLTCRYDLYQSDSESRPLFPFSQVSSWDGVLYRLVNLKAEWSLTCAEKEGQGTEDVLNVGRSFAIPYIWSPFPLLISPFVCSCCVSNFLKYWVLFVVVFLPTVVHSQHTAKMSSVSYSTLPTYFLNLFPFTIASIVQSTIAQ